MSVALKATLTKKLDGSWSIDLIGDQPETAIALFNFAIDKGLIDVRDQPPNLSRKLVLARERYSVSSNFIHLEFKTNGGYTFSKSKRGRNRHSGA